MRSFGNVRNGSGYIVITDMFVRRRRVNVLPRAVHRESTAARRGTSDARATLFVFFFCLFICNFFKRCFFPAIPPFRSDCCFSFHFYAGSVRISSSPITLAQPTTRSPQTPRPFSFATQPVVSPIDGQIHTRYSNQSPVNDAMAKPTHARGHIYSLAEVAKRKSLSSSAIHCRLMPA